ncbi:MAG TPA: PHB depolymerase family esterase [Microvirga sp.]|jgi:feruloyl esterase|nr:PHB depolymerase family esterase [Microvirga sp.]
MRSLGKTTAQLQRFKKQWEQLAAAQGAAQGGASEPGRLTPLGPFGSNPGNLKGFTYVPADLAPGAPLVVVLHGCTQNAAGYDLGAGWSALADRHGFAVLCPEQQQANNPKLCFNWFQPEDTTRDGGEALSIRQMTEAMIARHGLDRRRVFVTGLSAGGAMTAVMLATYPDVYAGGAIIAGLPYGGAGNVQEALEGMFQGRELAAREWGNRVRAASPHRGAWPKLSVWHGSADPTVKPMNADEIVKQWTDLHGIALDGASRSTGAGFTRQTWSRDGEALVESYTIAGMAHGTPLSCAGGIGRAGPFLLEAGISSSERILEFWGLAPETDLNVEILPPLRGSAKPEPQQTWHTGEAASGTDVGSIIARALRQAGLMKN